MLVALAATAAADPLELRATVVTVYDSNIFRVPGGVAVPNGRDEKIVQAQAGGRVEANVSLQQFVIDASVTRYEFTAHNDLSYTGIAANGTWRWRIASRFAGSAGYDLQRRQTSFAELRQTGRNIVTVRQPFVEGRYQPGRALFAYGGYREIKGTNTLPILQVSDYKSKVASGGAGYALSNGGELRFGVRRTDTHFPNNQFVRIGGVLVALRNDFRLDELEGSISYPLGPKTLLSGRVAYTDRKVEQVASRDFSGITGRLVLDYRPSALLEFQISPRRELTGADDIQTNFVTTDALSGFVEYRPRAYIAVRADGEVAKRTYEGIALVAPTAGRDDHSRSYGLSANYSWPLGSRLDLGLRRESRRSSIAVLDYHATVASAGFTLVF